MESNPNQTYPQLYYTPPSDECFNDLKTMAMTLWGLMGDEDTYRQEKIGRIKDIQNVGDNFMYMVAMFDNNNQCRLAGMLNPETRREVRERMIDGGTPGIYIPF